MSDADGTFIKHPWEVFVEDGVLLICRGDHSKAHACKFERWVPEAERDLAASTFKYQTGKIGRLQDEVADLRALLATAIPFMSDDGDDGSTVIRAMQAALREGK